MYYDIAKEMWDAVKETYSNVDNTSAVLKSRAYSMIYVKMTAQSQSILILSIVTGSNWMYMMKLNGAAQRIKRSTKNWWRKIESTSFY